MYALHEPDDISFDRAGIKGKVFPLQNISNKIDFLLVETETGHETTIIEHESDFVYYVLEGNGYFEIDGEKEDCTKGDLVVVPAGMKFTYKGTLKMALTCAPAWREEQEEVL